jgi:ribosome-associated heat shock protein Hsp15
LSEQLRIDKWLWHARFCKTRAIAQQKSHQGRIRLNGQVVRKASTTVRIGDTMTLTHLGKVMVIKVLDLGARRGPATEASALYEAVEDGVTES